MYRNQEGKDWSAMNGNWASPSIRVIAMNSFKQNYQRPLSESSHPTFSHAEGYSEVNKAIQDLETFAFHLPGIPNNSVNNIPLVNSSEKICCADTPAFKATFDFIHY